MRMVRRREMDRIVAMTRHDPYVSFPATHMYFETASHRRWLAKKNMKPNRAKERERE